ncbi:hypothetical protein WA026_005747 [Henosepilachna vigintioctopunctata]|uniref:Uncharacterized protein n=1 Tax=Henosepilachna vigintioctopunctata TaxID=420089 RepID=A0AAW1TTN5_9CUCU
MADSPKMVAGDGDGIKQNIIRYHTPSSKKYPSPIKKNEPKFSNELALKGIHGSHKSKKSYKRRNAETMTVDTPSRVTKRKPMNYIHDKVANIYCSPRFSAQTIVSKNAAGRKIFKYLLLKSWRRSRSVRKELSLALKNRDEKLTQLDMQIDVLQNLRKLESARREETHKKYQELQKDLDQLVEENKSLKEDIESIRKECFAKVKELNEKNQQLNNYKNIFDEKQQSLRVLKEKLDKEKEKFKRCSTERKNSTEQNVKLENTLNILKEKVENLTNQIQLLQNSKHSLENALEKSEKMCENYADKLRKQSLLEETYKSKIEEYEKEKMEMDREMKNLQMHLDIAHYEYSHMKSRNDDIEKDILDISRKLDDEKEKSPWNLMKKGVSSTYFAFKYLANLMLPAIQSNLRY